jgi:hypothetical protein
LCVITKLASDHDHANYYEDDGEANEVDRVCLSAYPADNVILTSELTLTAGVKSPGSSNDPTILML